MENFEEELKKMEKPDVPELKHQEMLLNAIIKAKDRSYFSWWWLSIPVYILAAFIMKAFYMPGSTLVENLGQFESQNKYLSIPLFLVLPIVLIILNFLSIKEIYYLSGSPRTMSFFKSIWMQMIVLIIPILILIIYILLT